MEVCCGQSPLHNIRHAWVKEMFLFYSYMTYVILAMFVNTFMLYMLLVWSCMHHKA